MLKLNIAFLTQNVQKEIFFLVVPTRNLDTHLAKILVCRILKSKMLNWNFAMGGVGGGMGWVRVFNPFAPRIHNEICQTP